MDPKKKIAAAAGGMLTITAASTAVIAAYGSLFDKTVQHDSKLSRQEWIEELLRGHDGRFYNEMGMRKHVFWRLVKALERTVGFGDTRHISAEEQLGIFLHYARRSLSNRALQERFQHSGDTISMHVLAFCAVPNLTIPFCIVSSTGYSTP